ncbi:MAG: DUF4142 domain-containing protein [Pseudomonadota bacterium]|nr:DUF4142 domain-containing protein [Pseudomonadota bacterium]
MLRSADRTLLPLLWAAAAVGISACGDRNKSPSTPPSSGAAVAPTLPTNTAAPTSASPAVAATPPTSGAPAVTTNVTIAAPDREFFVLALSGDLLEIESGRLALEKSQSSSVRAFAQKMVDEHSKASENLHQAAAGAGVVVPTAATSPAHVAHLEKLRTLSGVDFDREYAAQIGVAGHQEAIALFERAAREAANADVRAVAASGLSGKREHLELGQALAKAIGVTPDRLRMALAPPDLSSLSATIAGGPNPAGAVASGATPIPGSK